LLPPSKFPPYKEKTYAIVTLHDYVFKCIHLILPDRYKEVIETARRHNLLIVCDDVYNLLYFADKPPARLYSYDTKYYTSVTGCHYI